MANPRKFKEKIALVKQKEVEGTAEFEKIMKEVLDVKSKVEDAGTNTRVPSGAALPYRESRGRSVGGGPMRRPSERKVDTSPYSGGANVYLSPPNESTWRRASSDSAIHQSLSLVQDKNNASRNFESANQKRYAQPVALNNRINEPNRNLSSFELSQGPSNLLNSSYMSAADQLSASLANTGSLPDLTSVHFPGTLKTAIYKEPETSSSPYSSSPVTSPATLSPISMPNRNTYSRAHSPSDSNTYSPTNFGNRNHQENEFASYQQAQIGQTSHLSFTNLPGLVHQNKGSSISAYNTVHGSHGHLTSIGMNAPSNLSEYRNPQSRPSPGSSPGILPNMQGNETNPNSPCSPMSDHKSSHSHDNFQNHRNDGFNINQSFQNNFEHISLVDSNNSDQINNLPQAQDIFSSIQYDGNSFVHFEPSSPGQYGTSSNQPYNDVINSADKLNNMAVSRNENYSNPKRDTSCDMINMPTKIPEIVFSDFSTGNQDFPKEIFGSLDLELGQMDVAGYQMLADPNSPMITDPMIEDGFRRDLN